MMQTIYWLILGFVFLLLIFLPRVGLLAQYRKWRTAMEREKVEDALKHLLDRQSEGRFGSLESLSGTLGMRPNRIIRLIQKMEAQGLVVSRGSQLQLTAAGERWAIHIVRAHRLWERYLADEARMPLNQIHRLAHRREHTLSEQQLDELDAALGHPTRDPHGDPIPSREGTIDELAAVQLTELLPGERGRVARVSDRDPQRLRYLGELGLYPGAEVTLIEILPFDGPMRLRVAGNEHMISRPLAAAVSVDRLEPNDAPNEA